MTADDRTVAVLGGAVAGLAAAEALRGFGSVTVFDRQRYDDRRVDCGEAINDATLIPLAPTPENGFVNDVSGFEMRVFEGTERPATSAPVGRGRFPCRPGYVCERDRVERRWAERLRTRGVAFETGRSVTTGRYREIVEEYDYVVDATGQPSLTAKAGGWTDRYTGSSVALNATVEGEFDGYRRWPRVFFEGYVGYAWSFPKSADRANVGIGWAGDDRPDDYVEALWAAAERNGFPKPDRADVNVYTIPRGPSLDPRLTHDPERNVFLVGDAAGIANRYQGEGIVQSIRSAYLLGRLLERGEEERYPALLARLMGSEYRLAHLMRGAWTEFEDPALLAALVEAIDGLSVETVTRRPDRVYRRLLRRPGLALRLLADRGMLRRLYEGYADRWEYGTDPTPSPVTAFRSRLRP